MEPTARPRSDDSDGFIDLDRRFAEAPESETDDPNFITYLALRDGGLRWEVLLKRPRVVVLANAGSGKSTELKEQKRRCRADGKYAFFATLQNIGQRGFDVALESDAAALQAWRASDSLAWFFLDSVDEAKGDNLRLSEVLERIATGIKGHEARTHIVLSGRYADWEFRADLKRLATILPVPQQAPAPPALTAEDWVEKAVSDTEVQTSEQAKPEQPLVVLMAPLDRERVALFARENAIGDVEAFLQATERAHLWHFAERPMDLGWLVNSWKEEGRFAPYAQMLERNLRARLKEPDAHRGRSDTLEEERALGALERIGAELTLGRLQYVLVPDATLDLSDSRKGLKLDEILPNWNERDRERLLNRAVFEPVTGGLVRLYHDNAAEVRSFLTARWLKRLRDKGCPRSVLNDLLFATTYGQSLLIPSMRQAAAWLALSDETVGREIIAREPRWLLEYGDPSSLSLALRIDALDALVQQHVRGDHVEQPSWENLQRFAQENLAPAIRAQWTKHHGTEAVRELLLQLIEHGTLHACADLAAEAAYGPYTDSGTQVHAGHALLATGDEAALARYGRHLVDHAATIPDTMIYHALEALFPRHVSIDGLFQILDAMDLRHPSGVGFHYYGEALPTLLESTADLEQLLVGLLARHAREATGTRSEEHVLLPAIEATSQRLLERLPPDQVSLPAVDGVLSGREDRRYGRGAPGALLAQLHASPQRRRAAMWQAAQRFPDAPRRRNDDPFTQVWHLEVAGYPPGLTVEDVDWLLEDVACQTLPGGRQLAASALLRLAQQHSDRPDILTRLRAAAAEDTALTTELNRWLEPPTPSASEKEHEDWQRNYQREQAERLAADRQSLQAFVAQLQADPNQLRTLAPPSVEGGMDSRLYGLWKLLNQFNEDRSHLAVQSLDVLKPLLGEAVVAALREAFIAFWRNWSPTLASAREVHQRQVMNEFDMIGMVGVSLDAATSPAWAQQLTPDKATRAAAYATLEMNGFPAFLTPLAEAHPGAMRAVLLTELDSELNLPDPALRTRVLDDLERADPVVAALVADPLFDRLRGATPIPLRALSPMLSMVRAHGSDRAALATLLRQRIEASTERYELATYLEHLFPVDPIVTMAALEAKVKQLDESAQTRLVLAVLPRIAGGRFSSASTPLEDIPLSTLENLVRLAHRTIRPQEDNDHPPGKAYSPDDRDDGEMARSIVLRALIDRPGLAAYHTVQRLKSVAHLEIPPKRIALLAFDRAATDSEHDPWKPTDVIRFEQQYQRIPHTALDLQRLVLWQLDDLQHDLINAQFAQGPNLAGLRKEENVQSWMGDHFEGSAKQSYVVVREKEVVNRKKPDISFEAVTVSGVSVPMEIKRADSCNLEQLDAALADQLVGRYLRDRNNRFGILLVVLQRPKPAGWRTATGKRLTFSEVMARLNKKAEAIASASGEAPQPRVATIDVSSTATVTGKKRKKRARASKKAERKKTRVSGNGRSQGPAGKARKKVAEKRKRPVRRARRKR